MTTNGNGNGQQTGTAVAAQSRPPLKTGGAVAAVVPQDIDQAFRLATAISTANMAPKGFERDQNKIVVAILHGLEIGLTPMAALQSIAVINGTPTLWGDGVLAVVQASGMLVDIEERIEGEDTDSPVAVCTVKRQGRATPTTRTFDRATAAKAGLWNKPGPWTQYPLRMLQMRARSFALRDAFPDVLKGLRAREEVEDSQTLEQAADGSYAPAPPRPTRAQFEQQAVQTAEDADARSAPPPPPAQRPPTPEAANDADAWLISPEAFPSLGKFSDEWRRQLEEACGTPEDVDALVAANDARLSMWSADRSTKAAVGALQADADARRAYLAEAA